MIIEIQSNNFSELEKSVRDLRMTISEESEGPFKECIAADLAPVLIALLNPAYQKLFDVQYEAAWCLSNIASSDTSQTAYLIGEGLLNVFLTLLKHNDQVMLEQVRLILFFSTHLSPR